LPLSVVIAVFVAALQSSAQSFSSLSLVAAISRSWCRVFVIAVDVAAISVATVFVTATKILLPLLLLVVAVVVALAVVAAVGRWRCSRNWILRSSDP